MFNVFPAHRQWFVLETIQDQRSSVELFNGTPLILNRFQNEPLPVRWKYIEHAWLVRQSGPNLNSMPSPGSAGTDYHVEASARFIDD